MHLRFFSCGWQCCPSALSQVIILRCANESSQFSSRIEVRYMLMGITREATADDLTAQIREEKNTEPLLFCLGHLLRQCDAFTCTRNKVIF